MHNVYICIQEKEALTLLDQTRIYNVVRLRQLQEQHNIQQDIPLFTDGPRVSQVPRQLCCCIVVCWDQLKP